MEHFLPSLRSLDVGLCVHTLAERGFHVRPRCWMQTWCELCSSVPAAWSRRQLLGFGAPCARRELRGVEWGQQTDDVAWCLFGTSAKNLSVALQRTCGSCSAVPRSSRNRELGKCQSLAPRRLG